MSELAIRRFFVRSKARSKRKRPSWWRILTLCWLALLLLHIAVSVLDVMAGKTWQMFFLVFWVLMYWMWWRLGRLWAEREEQGLISPPWGIQWALLAINVALIPLTFG